MPRQVKQKEDENTVLEEEEDKRGPWYHRVVWVIEKQIKLIPFLGLLSQQHSSGSVDTPSTIQHQRMVNTLQGNGYIYGQEEEEEAYHGPHNIEGNYNNIDSIGRRRIEIKGIEVEDIGKRKTHGYICCVILC